MGLGVFRGEERPPHAAYLRHPFVAFFMCDAANAAGVWWSSDASLAPHRESSLPLPDRQTLLTPGSVFGEQVKPYL